MTLTLYIRLEDLTEDKFDPSKLPALNNFFAVIEIVTKVLVCDVLKFYRLCQKRFFRGIKFSKN